ncbi:MAG: hypothetical protein NZ898_02685 [Myxococcota bacterium]|nr:hypothetical protein [Myxococcota bacterium]MDW8361279.1 hypothetical protein [Myxococcales bacterium]
MSARACGLVASIASIAALSVRPPTVGAQPARAVRAEVLIVLAREEPGAVDPQLAGIAALARPPFNAFRQMQVLARPRLELRAAQPAMVELPNGRRLQIILQQLTPDGRYRVRVSINRPGQNDYLPLLQVVASPGDPFFVAGQQHEGGTLVVGIRVGERPTAGVEPGAASPSGG